MSELEVVVKQLMAEVVQLRQEVHTLRSASQLANLPSETTTEIKLPFANSTNRRKVLKKLGAGMLVAGLAATGAIATQSPQTAQARVLTDPQPNVGAIIGPGSGFTYGAIPTTVKYGLIVTSNSTLSNMVTATQDTAVYAHSSGMGLHAYSSEGYGVYAEGGTTGVVGKSTNGTGIGGISQYGHAVIGQSNSGYGIYGKSTTSTAVQAYSSEGYGIYAEGGGAGIIGRTTNGTAIGGDSHYGPAISGQSTSGYGVWGVSLSNYGVNGESTNNFGVRGKSVNTHGVFGLSDKGYGIRGQSNTTAGIYGSGPVGINGYSAAGTAISANSDTGTAISANSDSGPGVYAYSKSNVALHALSITGVPLRIKPDNRPSTGEILMGAMYVDMIGNLWVYNGSEWKRVVYA